MADEFVSIPLTTDADELFQEVVGRMQQRWPDWEPNPGNPETVLIYGWAYMYSALAVLAASMPEEAFHQAGKTLFSLPPQEASSAQGETTWTAIDDRGYRIDAGTQIVVPVSGDENRGFEVLETVVIDPGRTATAAGEVIVQAVVAGSDSNDLTENPEPADALDWIESIVLEDPTAGGEDAETVEDYSTRLRRELQLLTPRPIVPADFEVRALQTPGVERALAVDGYNPADRTYRNERMVAVSVVDEEGNDPGRTVTDAVDADLQSKREVSFIVNMITPDYTAIEGEVTVTPLPGFDGTSVRTKVEEAWATYFDPANWGLPLFGDPGTGGGWRLVDRVRFYDVVALLEGVDGVDYITGLRIARSGGALDVVDIDLTGPAPLTRPDTLTVTVA